MEKIRDGVLVGNCFGNPDAVRVAFSIDGDPLIFAYVLKSGYVGENICRVPKLDSSFKDKLVMYLSNLQLNNAVDMNIDANRSYLN